MVVCMQCNSLLLVNSLQQYAHLILPCLSLLPFHPLPPQPSLLLPSPSSPSSFSLLLFSSPLPLSIPAAKVRNVKRFTWVEWVFVVVVTLSLLVVLALTIERFVFFESTFVNITIDTTNGTELSDCNQWTCTNDVVFAVVVLINLCKSSSNFCP